MSDVKVSLYLTPQEPEKVLEISYEQLAKMTTREIVMTLSDQLIDACEPTETRLKLEARGEPIQVNWLPLNDDREQMKHQLEIQTENLVREFRS